MKINRLLLIILWAFFFTPCLCLAAAEQNSLVGKYYLKGVTNVGSELVLRSDGGYQWMLAEGNQDLVSEGSWSRQGATIVLRASLPAAAGPLFQLDSKQPTEPWYQGAEQSLQEWLYRQQRDKVLKDCPFMDSNEHASQPKPIGEPELAKPELDRRANLALQKLKDVTAAFERVASSAVRLKTEAAMNEAMDAAYQFEAAWLAAKETSWDAGRTAPDHPVLNMPDTCRLPKEPLVSEDKPVAWSRQGIGIIVLDAASGAPIRLPEVTFVFADGASRSTNLARDGAYVVPIHAKELLVSLALTIGEGKAEKITLPTAMAPGTLFRILVDTARFLPPPFERLQFEIDGNELLWPEVGGSYQRQ